MGVWGKSYGAMPIMGSSDTSPCGDLRVILPIGLKDSTTCWGLTIISQQGRGLSSTLRVQRQFL